MRLGSGLIDAQEIVSHAFFKGTNSLDYEFTSVTLVLTPVQSGIFSVPNYFVRSC